MSNGRNTLEMIVAVAIIAAMPSLACAESWVLWETKAFRNDSSGEPVRWRTVKVYPSEDACKAEGRKIVNAIYTNPDAIKGLASVKPPYGPAKMQLADDGMRVDSVGPNQMNPSRPTVFGMQATSCWPVGVNPQ